MSSKFIYLPIYGDWITEVKTEKVIGRITNWAYDLLKDLPNYDNFPVAKTCRSLILAMNFTLWSPCLGYILTSKTIPPRPNALPPAGIMFLEDGWERNWCDKLNRLCRTRMMSFTLLKLWVLPLTSLIFVLTHCQQCCCRIFPSPRKLIKLHTSYAIWNTKTEG
jgi:hypothetical protein